MEPFGIGNRLFTVSEQILIIKNKIGNIMLYELTITQFNKMLGNLSSFLDKAALLAETKKFDINVLMTSRLAPDQFNFIRQVQITCDTAKLAVARLSGQIDSVPVHPDTEISLDELQARIRSVRDYLSGFSAGDFAGFEERHITQPRWEGKYLTGTEYVIQHAIPNFYFHLSTAYSILRHNGVDLGKKDYLGALPYKG
jgi:uncharacterized protein